METDDDCVEGRECTIILRPDNSSRKLFQQDQHTKIYSPIIYPSKEGNGEKIPFIIAKTKQQTKPPDTKNLKSALCCRDVDT